MPGQLSFSSCLTPQDMPIYRAPRDMPEHNQSSREGMSNNSSLAMTLMIESMVHMVHNNSVNSKKQTT